MHISNLPASDYHGEARRPAPQRRRRRRPHGRHGRHGMRTVRALCALLVVVGMPGALGSAAQAAAADIETPRLSGGERYSTSVEIAEGYRERVAADGVKVDTVIVTSGSDEHFGYVLPTPALSRRHHAPVLLTEPGRLPTAVKRFIERSDIKRVIIVGGTDVVSADVAQAIDRLDGVGIERIGDNDVYTTAAAVASRVGAVPGRPGEFRRSGRTVLLTTGEKFPDALAAGPLAYRGQHPILLTQRHRLPAAAADFLARSRTDHVVILGGTAAVSSAVERALDAQAINVTRWFGDDRYETAAEVARALLGGDSPQRCFEGADAGLASGLRSPDAIVSGPLLGEMCAPLLLSRDHSLPSATRAVLSSTELFRGDAKGRLTITAFGGISAVSQTVLRAAAGAASLSTLTARIDATEGGCAYTVRFDEPVRSADASQVRHYTRDGSPLTSSSATIDVGAGQNTQRATVVFRGGVRHSEAAAITGCPKPLGSGEQLGVKDGVIGGATGIRSVRQATGAARPDRSRPRLSIRAVQGASVVLITSNEPVQAPASRFGLGVEFRRSGEAPQVVDALISPGVTSFSVYLPSRLDDGEGLRVNDRVMIAADEFEDLAGNGSTQVSALASADRVQPRVRRVEVSAPSPVSSATALLSGGPGAGGQGTGPLQLTARDGAAAAGATGNQWSVGMSLLRRAPDSWAQGQGSQATVQASRRMIDIEVLDTWTVGALAAELNADSRFSALFEAQARAGGSSLTVRPSVGRVRFSGGTSAVDLTVTWSEAIQGCVFGTEPMRLEDIVIDVDGNGTGDLAMDGTVLDRSSGAEFVGGGADSPSLLPRTAACDYTTPGVLTGTLVARVQASDASDLPSGSSLARVPPNVVRDFAENGNASQLRLVVRER